MKQNWTIVALLGAITFTSAAFADTSTEPIVLDEIVVTATRMPQPLAQTIADTTVINEQEIRQSSAPDVPTLLRSLAGVEIVQSGGLGKQSSTFMRGTNSSHVLVLVDGVRINSATDGPTALNHIMLDSIDRIEVVRGNVSSLYGSEAIGGVIQLFTKRGHGAPALSASAGLGSHGTQRVSVGFLGNVDANSFSVNVGKTKTDGVSAINTSIKPTANPDKDGYDNTTLNAQVKHTFNANHQLSASVFSTRSDSQYDDAFGVVTDHNNTMVNIDKLSLTSDNQLNAMWHSSVRLAQGIDESKDYQNDVQQSRLQTKNNQFAWQNELTIAEAQKLNLALEHLGQAVSASDVTDPSPYTQTKRTVNSFLGGYIAEYGAQQVQFNLRQDRYSDFGAANTGLFGYGVSFADKWRATASVSNAFKAPTFNELYRTAWGGNPNLKPEQANNREAAIHYVSGGQNVDVVYFDNRIHNLIDSGFPAINIDRARIDGFELTYAGKIRGTQFKVNVTSQNPRDTATGNVLPRRAKEYASVAASHDFGVWNAGAELRHSGERKNSNFDNFVLPSYQLFNLNAGYKVNTHLNLLARVDNLFNRNYSEAYSYNTLGRTLFVGLSYQQ
ncbi:MAG: TonB-dependent receptor [Gallionella sp.]|nr:TonB-dependent receptor [Gallionella sp.]